MATSFLHRLRGLIGSPALGPGECMLLRPGGSVHTAFMGYAIDVAFLDAAGRVLRVESKVRPWRVRLAPRGTRATVELPAGAGMALRQGMQIEVCEREGSD